MGLNSVCISGNLVRDAQLRTTLSGTDVLRGTIATDDRYRDKTTGEWVNDPSYIDFVLFGERARALCDYLSKGTKVSLGGKIKQIRWNDKKSGKPLSRIEIQVSDNLEFLSPRDSDSVDSGVVVKTSNPTPTSYPKHSLK